VAPIDYLLEIGVKTRKDVLPEGLCQGFCITVYSFPEMSIIAVARIVRTLSESERIQSPQIGGWGLVYAQTKMATAISDDENCRGKPHSTTEILLDNLI
jgi:hypothetical protein